MKLCIKARQGEDSLYYPNLEEHTYSKGIEARLGRDILLRALSHSISVL